MTVSIPSEPSGDDQEFEGNNPLKEFYKAFEVEEDGSEEYSKSVTRLMHQYHDGDTANREAIKNDLWEAVMDQLVAKATAVKESYPRLWELPEAMVSDVFKELDNVLQDVSLDNREQFYAIAGLRFHWLLLKKLKTNKTQDVSLEVIPDPADPDSSPAEVAEEEDLIRTIVSAFRGFYSLLIGFMGLGLVVGIAGLGVISTRAVVERRQQIGVLRAIGYRRHMVQMSFMLESSFIALLGTFLGILLGLILSHNVITDIRTEESIDSLRWSVPVIQISLIVVASYLFSLLATYLPARQASRIYPAEALRYE